MTHDIAAARRAQIARIKRILARDRSTDLVITERRTMTREEFGEWLDSICVDVTDDSDMNLLANDPGERCSFEAAAARLDAGQGIEVTLDDL
jgi:hypothetical protein